MNDAINLHLFTCNALPSDNVAAFLSSAEFNAHTRNVGFILSFVNLFLYDHAGGKRHHHHADWAGVLCHPAHHCSLGTAVLCRWSPDLEVPGGVCLCAAGGEWRQGTTGFVSC